MAALVLVRGMGPIGRRHARVFRSLGHDVRGWPVRPSATRRRRASPLLGREGLGGRRRRPVVVATDIARHDEDASRCWTRARRVLVEKPVAPIVADAQRLVAHPLAEQRVKVAAPLRAHLGFRHFHAADDALERPRFAAVASQSWLPSWRPERDYRDSYSARRGRGGRAARPRPRDRLRHRGPGSTAAGHGRPRREGPLGDGGRAGSHPALGDRLRVGDRARRLRHEAGPARCPRDVPERQRHLGPDHGDGDTASAEGATDARARPRTSTATGSWRDRLAQRLTMSGGAPLAERLDAGAPASLAEGLLAVQVCDDARSFRHEEERPR